MAYPKIQWTDADGNQHTVLFQLPPTSKPYRDREATRTDTLSTAGVKQSVWLRTDDFLDITMNYVEVEDDIQAFDDFMDFALQGNSFLYFPDAENDQDSTSYTLEDTSWKPQFACYRYFKFVLRFRKEVEG